MKIKIGDIILIFLLIIFGIVIYFTTFKNISSKEKYISIQVNGKEIERIKMSDNKEQIYRIDNEYGLNVLEIKNNSVRVIEADCPDQTDVLQGKISKVGQSLVCLPHRLVVEIVGEREVETELINY